MTIKSSLSVRSDFSIGESSLKVGDIVAEAKKLGLEAVALVDMMTVSSMVEFANKAKKEGIKPIVGCTLRIYDCPTYRKPSKASGQEERINRSYQIKVYVHDDRGLRSLLKLLSKANTEEYFYYHARVGLDDVMELENVSVTTGDLFNIFHHPDHFEIIKRLMSKFQTFIEIVPIDTPLFDTLNEKALNAAELLGCPLIAGYPTFYKDAGQADSLDVLRAITTNTKMNARSLPIPYVRDYCFDSGQTLLARLENVISGLNDSWFVEEILEECLEGIEKLTASCAYEFKKLPPSLPQMAPDEFLKLVEEVKKGWTERFSKPVLGHQPTKEQLSNEYRQRLAYEMGILKKMGFSGYFLLVQDIVRWSKDNGIMVGPGRGSVGGSLVAYLLGITDSDPIRFNLLFERFINPSRIDLPDADLDFMSSRRPEVIQYIVDKYGADKVAGVSNYTTLGAASAIRSVARIYDMQPFDYACSKQVEREHGVALSLEESAVSVPDIGKFKDRYPDIWGHAVNLEGVMRSLGQHAAGIVIAAEPIVNRAIVETRTGGPVVNWDKQYVEEWGLIKMDILGLSTLDVLKLAKDYIRARHGKEIDFLRLPLDEPAILSAFGSGQTVGVFQFEGGGMKKVLQDLAKNDPLNFEDLTATTALYRPGPIDAGFVDDYINVKQGIRAPYYEHPSMEKSLAYTHGVIVYQEQIMQICQDLAGFTLTDADHVRKAMGKKDAVKMAEWKEKFIEGAVKSGMGELAADMLWGKIEGFAAYAFNRSHATTYSILSYWSMYIKVHYPAEFFAATMSVVDKEEKLSPLVLDARRAGMVVLPPDINKSSDKIEIEGENILYMPFQAVKGISTTVADYIMKAKREFGTPFTEQGQFEKTLTKLGIAGKVNKGHKEKLYKVGAFVSIQPGELPATHPSRLKDQLSMLPGFAVDSVKADRGIPADELTVLEIMKLSGELRGCDKCKLQGTAHPTPRIGKSPKFMVVFDAPNWDEAKKGRMLEGEAASYLKAALKDVGLSANDGYYTALVKAPKPVGEKMMPNDVITACSGYLTKEIELLKPPVIVAMGSNAIRFFAPTIKGPSSELIGKVIFDPKLDASIVFGLNPTQIVFDASKAKMLQLVAEKLAELVT